MIYSVHDDRNGGFLYYEASGPAINADFQTPSFSKKSPLGVPAVHASRPLPRGAKQVGSGAMPKGTIASRGGGSAWSAVQGAASRGGVDPSGLGGFEQVDPVKAAMAAATGVVVFLVANKYKLPKVASAILATGAGGYVYGFSPIKAAIVGVLPP